ncbi:hypothetical protein CASFOL_029759 [Castilleja foliolosa]|uniref:Uncharacterized protein n=1 Tax=Castilleja foliolosa TaxID=1961234 RepID=A0ABD3C8R4_9LAMI
MVAPEPPPVRPRRSLFHRVNLMKSSGTRKLRREG